MGTVAMGKMIQPFWVLLVMLMALSPAALPADSITLKDGTQVEGDLKRNPDGSGWTITTSDGKVRSIAADAVKSVQLGSSSASGSSAAEGLASLRRSVDAV